MAWTYVMDTSALIDMADSYPESAFRGVWDGLGRLARDKRALAPVQVSEEVHRPEFLRQWCDENEVMFITSTRNVWDLARRVTKEFPKLVDSDTPGSQADPFIVALAVTLKSSLSGDEPIIITHEDPHKLNKIPSIAKTFGVESDRMTGIFEREGWKF